MMRKQKRDLRTGRYSQDRTFWKHALASIGAGAIVGASMIGINNISLWVKSLDKVFVVEKTQAEEIIKAPTLEDNIYAIAKEYGISGYQMYRTINCETKFRNIQSQVFRDGRQEQSFGLAQIHLPDWPEVSKSDALDEDFSIRWMAEHWNTAKWFAYNRKLDKCI